ncbi:hypothetical protein ND486_09550 [Pseudonocardia sp. DR1-2]|uniref:hypothetical protein n=1 Tax=Pseudonocardia sp. DR1-2 TaxID=2951168 RepID=UPI00204354BA|nr:hypothetical protein [Pseudonocardia sp. DR1-2]MCM3846433.1 hypothetical protein [Pseudonocardia sp. DR1-2]
MRTPNPSAPVLLPAAGVLLAAGLVVGWVTGLGRAAVLGLCAALLCVMASGYTWMFLDAHGHPRPGVRVPHPLPRDVVALFALVLPAVAGLVAGPVLGDWRFAAAGLLAGAFLPGTITAWRTSFELDGASGILFAGVGWFFLGLLAGPPAWLWAPPGSLWWLAFAIPMGIGVCLVLTVGLE